jgi:hypothetical protein
MNEYVVVNTHEKLFCSLNNTIEAPVQIYIVEVSFIGKKIGVPGENHRPVASH